MTPRHSKTPPIGLLTGLLGLTLALGLACDDAGETRKDAATAGKGEYKQDPDAAAVPQKFKNPGEAIIAYNDCYSGCFSARTSATNRETCKLDCDSLAETGMDTLTDEPSKATYKQTWQTLRGCVTLCFEDKKLNATNRQTCLLTCSDEAEVEALNHLPGAMGMPGTPGTPPTKVGTTPVTPTTPTTPTTPPTKVGTTPVTPVTPRTPTTPTVPPTKVGTPTTPVTPTTPPAKATTPPPVTPPTKK